MFMRDFAKGGLQGSKRNPKSSMGDENLNYAPTYIWHLIPNGSSGSAGVQIYAPVDRGRDNALDCIAPPSEPGKRVSRTRLSS